MHGSYKVLVGEVLGNFMSLLPKYVHSHLQQKLQYLANHLRVGLCMLAIA